MFLSKPYNWQICTWTTWGHRKTELISYNWWSSSWNLIVPRNWRHTLFIFSVFSKKKLYNSNFGRKFQVGKVNRSKNCSNIEVFICLRDVEWFLPWIPTLMCYLLPKLLRGYLHLMIHLLVKIPYFITQMTQMFKIRLRKLSQCLIA